jgi:hypothetical protein
MSSFNSRGAWVYQLWGFQLLLRVNIFGQRYSLPTSGYNIKKVLWRKHLVARFVSDDGQ